MSGCREDHNSWIWGTHKIRAPTMLASTLAVLQKSPGVAASSCSPQGFLEFCLLLQGKAKKSEPRRKVWITPPSSF